MAKAARKGDICGGKIVGNVATSVLINGEPAALVGSIVSPHGKGRHGAPTIVTGTSVIVEGRQLAAIGDSASCGHKISTGSDVDVG